MINYKLMAIGLVFIAFGLLGLYLSSQVETYGEACYKLAKSMNATSYSVSGNNCTICYHQFCTTFQIHRMD